MIVTALVQYQARHATRYLGSVNVLPKETLGLQVEDVIPALLDTTEQVPEPCKSLL